MTRLEDTYPNVHRQLTKGVHVVRRSHQFWVGLSAYLVIKQALTRSLKTSDGPTRQRSMPEPQGIVWYLPRPYCTNVNNAMQQLTSVTYQTSEQHKDVSHARQTWGTADLETLMSFIEWRSPFDADPSLRNIVSSISSRRDVNVDHAKRLEWLFFINWLDSFKRKAKAMPIDTHGTIDVDDDEVQIDPVILFQRLTISGKRSGQCSDPWIL